MRRVWALIEGGVGGALAFVVIAAQFGLFVGGISYRKDCLTTNGAVKSSWTFTWFAPIPYLFRPSEEGCQVHTGTRVALNRLGIAGFPKPTTVSLAKKQSANTANPDLAYFGQLKAQIVDYQKRSSEVKSVGEGQRLLDKVISALNGLTPTAKYSTAQSRLIALFTATKRYGREMQAAIAASDQTAYAAAAKRIQNQDGDMQAIVREINRLHATD